MKFVRVVTVILVALGCTRLPAAPTPPVRVPARLPAGTVLTLADALTLALQNQATIRQAQAQIQAETGALRQARAGQLPTVSASTTTQITGGPGSGHTQTQFAATQVLLDFGRTGALVSEARQTRAADVASLTGTTDDVVLSVKQAYYTLLEDEHLVAVFQQNLTQQQAHLAETRAQEAAGVTPHTTVLTAEAAVASAQFDLVTARNTAALARINLLVAMGVDVRSSVSTVETAEPTAPVPSEDDAVTLALAQRPEIVRDLDLIRAAQAGIRFASTGNLPALDATASYSPNAGATGIGQQRSIAVAVGMQWNFLDFGATAGAVEQARGQVAIAEETLYTDRQSITNEVVQARLNLLTAEAQLTNAEAEVAGAQASLNAAVGSYQAGVGIFLAVIDAQAALLKAQVDVYTARYGLSIARAQLEHATGATRP